MNNNKLNLHTAVLAMSSLARAVNAGDDVRITEVREVFAQKGHKRQRGMMGAGKPKDRNKSKKRKAQKRARRGNR